MIATAEDAEDSINTSELHTLGTPPSAFPITYDFITCDVVGIDWQTPTIEDGSDYYYELFTDGEYHKTTIKVIAISYSGAETEEEITFFQEPCPLPTDFERNTDYEVVVTAKAQNTYKTKESTASFTTTNDYPVHPDITVSEAKLITPDS